jgi:hypothetical protein
MHKSTTLETGSYINSDVSTLISPVIINWNEVIIASTGFVANYSLKINTMNPNYMIRKYLIRSKYNYDDVCSVMDEPNFNALTTYSNNFWSCSSTSTMINDDLMLIITHYNHTNNMCEWNNEMINNNISTICNEICITSINDSFIYTGFHGYNNDELPDTYMMYAIPEYCDNMDDKQNQFRVQLHKTLSYNKVEQRLSLYAIISISSTVASLVFSTTKTLLNLIESYKDDQSSNDQSCNDQSDNNYNYNLIDG